MYLKRFIEPHLKRLSTQYPVITITGPRQSGKTTLCQKVFPDKEYISLEKIEIRNLAKADPNQFLRRLAKGAILDEIQRVPELTSYLQEIVDSTREKGLFILTGSQNFEVMSNISQSLAGRTAILKLLPFSYGELYGEKKKSPQLNSLLYKGFYPRIYHDKLNPTEAYSFYTSTYVERDLRDLLNVKNLYLFEKFLKLCAGRTGQILNISNLASDTGINHNTAHHWLSILEASYIITLLQPHYKNFNKRLIKSPKMYFWDTGLAAFLLNIENENQLENSPFKGSLFETFVITELMKQRLHNIKTNNLFFWRDNTGHELDFIMEKGKDLIPGEIKTGETVAEDFFKNIIFYKTINPAVNKAYLIYGGNKAFQREGTEGIGFAGIEGINI